MPLDPATSDYVAIAGAVAGGLGLVVGAAAHIRLGRLRKRLTAFAGNAESGDVLDAMHQHLGEVRSLRADVAAVRADAQELRVDLGDAIRHVAVVRYDAFQDMGGRMSFSAALLDDAGDGIVLTSINGRSETRTYAKGVKAGASEHTLSPEEEQVISYAAKASTRRR